MTFHGSTNKCELCNDTGWIENENGYRRCTCYEIDVAKTRWEQYGVKQEDIKKIRDYKPYNQATIKAKELAAKYITEFNSIKSSRENSILFMGQAGGGKTHLITAIGAALIDKGVPVLYMPYIEVIRSLKANSMDDAYYQKIISKYQKAKVLIIDDLFKDKVKSGKLIGNLTETDIKHIYTIINYRYLNYLPTLISSECTPDMLNNLDEALAGRILETCANFGVVFNDECNYRLRKFKGA